MPLVARWGSEVRTTSPLEPGSNDPRPLSLTGVPAPISLPDLSKVFPANTPKPLKRFDTTTSSGGGRRRGGTVATPVDPPLAGLDISGAQVLPAPANGLDLDDATILAPANGLDVDSADVVVTPPANGLDIEGASILAPANGLDIDSTDVVVNPPAAGLDIQDASILAPANGLDVDDASVIPPAAGLDIDDASRLTLNIEIVSDESFVNSGSGSLGEIKYSSDVGYLFIFDGTKWQRTNGGNS